MKVIVKIISGKQSYMEDVTELEKQHWEDIFGNGANSHLQNMTFENWVKPIKDKCSDLDKYNVKDNNSHFIFGWFEAFAQSDDVAEWMFRTEETLEIQVLNEE